MKFYGYVVMAVLTVFSACLVFALVSGGVILAKRFTRDQRVLDIKSSVPTNVAYLIERTGEHDPVDIVQIRNDGTTVLRITHDWNVYVCGHHIGWIDTNGCNFIVK